MPTEPALGQRIMRRRQALGMSQEELARLVKVDRSTISTWETGKHFPKRYLGKLEAVLGISLEPPPGQPPITPEVQAILDGLTAEQRGYVIEKLREADGYLRGHAGAAAEPPARPRRQAG